MAYSSKPKRNRRPVNLLQGETQQLVSTLVNLNDGATTLVVSFLVFGTEAGDLTFEPKKMLGAPALQVWDSDGNPVAYTGQAFIVGQTGVTGTIPAQDAGDVLVVTDLNSSIRGERGERFVGTVFAVKP